MSTGDDLSVGSGRGGGRVKLAGRRRGAGLPSPHSAEDPSAETPTPTPEPAPTPAPSPAPTTATKKPAPKSKPSTRSATTKPRRPAKNKVEPLGAIKGRKREVLLRLLPNNVARLKERAALDPDITLGIATIDVVAEHVDELEAAPGTVERPGGAPPRRRARRYHAGGRTSISVLLEVDEATWLAQLVNDTGRSVSDLVDAALALD